MEEEKIKVAIIGGDYPGLELMALIKKLPSPSFEVAAVIDPNEDALLFHLADYGYQFADPPEAIFSSDLRTLEKIEGLSLIIDTTGNKDIHQALYNLDLHQVKILNRESGNFLIRMKLSAGEPNEEGEVDLAKRRIFIFQNFIGAANSINLAEHQDEFYELFLTTAMEATQADTGSVMLLNRSREYLYLVVARGLSPDYINALGRFPRIGEGIAGRVAQIGEPLLLSGRFEDLRFARVEEKNGIKSSICVPIKVGNNVLGVLNVGNKRSTSAFSREDLVFLSQFSNLAAKYIMEIATHQELKITQLEQQLTKAVGKIVSLSLPLKDKLQKAILEIANVLNLESLNLYLKESPADELTLRASTDITPSLFGILKLRELKGAIGKVVKTKRPLLLKEQSSYLIFDEDKKEGDRDMGEAYQFILPLLHKDKLLGVMSILFSERIDRSDYRLSLCQRLSHTLADTIHNQMETESQREAAVRLTTANEAGMSLVSIIDREKLAFTIAVSAVQLVNAEFVILRIYNKKENKLPISSFYHRGGDRLSDEIRRYDGELCLATFQSQSVETEASIPSKVEAIKSAIAFPLIVEEEILGVLSAYNRQDEESFSPIPFTENDRIVLDKFAFYAAMSLRNLRDFEERKQFSSVNELTGMYTKKILEARLLEEVKRADRTQGKFSLLMFKIANLNSLEVNIGISKTQLIKLVAYEIERHFRKSDILFHLEDDVFAVLLPEIGMQVEEALERFRSYLSRRNLRIRGLSEPLTLLAGYSSYPVNAFSPEELLEQASQYKEKLSFGGGEGRVKGISPFTQFEEESSAGA